MLMGKFKKMLSDPMQKAKQLLIDEALELFDEPEDELSYHSVCDNLDEGVFKLWDPDFTSDAARMNIFFSRASARKVTSKPTSGPSDEYINNILFGTIDAHRFGGHRANIDINAIDKDKLLAINDLASNYKRILDKIKMDNLSNVEMNTEEDIDQETEEAEDDEKLLVIMNSPLFAEVVKLQDKYSIRVGDGKYFVASDEIKVVFRDPSQRPAWGMWFLSAVPLNNIPSRASLLFQSEEQKARVLPEPIPDQLIICHASLWKLKENKTGLLMHVGWNHITGTYKWVIDKPMEIASMLFKTVSHPAHLARNFGYTPNLAIPGDSWL